MNRKGQKIKPFHVPESSRWLLWLIFEIKVKKKKNSGAQTAPTHTYIVRCFSSSATPASVWGFLLHIFGTHDALLLSPPAANSFDQWWQEITQVWKHVRDKPVSVKTNRNTPTPLLFIHTQVSFVFLLLQIEHILLLSNWYYAHWRG